MDEKMELIIMEIIVNSGNCRSCSMEAIMHAKSGDFEAAEKSLEQAGEDILKAHHVQTDLIQKEAGGEKTELSMLLIHCQDQLMTSMLCKDMAAEFVELYRSMKAS